MIRDGIRPDPADREGGGVGDGVRVPDEEVTVGVADEDESAEARDMRAKNVCAAPTAEE